MRYVCRKAGIDAKEVGIRYPAQADTDLSIGGRIVIIDLACASAPALRLGCSTGDQRLTHLRGAADILRLEIEFGCGV